MCDTCDDNRFELIEKYKQKLLDATNIKDSPEEMAVIDNILFRFWQMGWLRSELSLDAVPVVHGRWIDIDSEMYTWKIRCSKCGHERSMMSTGQIYSMYCENCGARMDGKWRQ